MSSLSGILPRPASPERGPGEAGQGGAAEPQAQTYPVVAQAGASPTSVAVCGRQSAVVQAYGRWRRSSRNVVPRPA